MAKLSIAHLERIRKSVIKLKQIQAIRDQAIAAYRTEAEIQKSILLEFQQCYDDITDILHCTINLDTGDITPKDSANG